MAAAVHAACRRRVPNFSLRRARPCRPGQIQRLARDGRGGSPHRGRMEPCMARLLSGSATRGRWRRRHAFRGAGADWCRTAEKHGAGCAWTTPCHRMAVRSLVPHRLDRDRAGRGIGRFGKGRTGSPHRNYQRIGRCCGVGRRVSRHHLPLPGRQRDKRRGLRHGGGARLSFSRPRWGTS